MKSKRHLLFNLAIIIIPWLSIIFLGKRNIKRYFLSSSIIAAYEILSHIHGQKKRFWKFYEKPRFFIRDELPFDIGPYIPMSMWMLKISYGNFKKFILLNAVYNALFAFVGMPLFKKMKIIRLHRLSHLQFFLYIHYKAYLLYGVQYLLERRK
ncbi:hypothetical protein MM300_19885 [Evansella sp. LMS18]|jgi:hypothetical protein|uniref:hypothetical protein n=1 Tax=Evansella sp. LMS18 TaxID=2924033 RepID=UPI0020D15C48|nr:hypothetical protein [Evansella sp. LMS18]UTR10112.1 hypothetical protein MM300_19885 [Evansella sp. LMS18]